jgi:hypothetical protein
LLSKIVSIAHNANHNFNKSLFASSLFFSKSDLRKISPKLKYLSLNSNNSQLVTETFITSFKLNPLLLKAIFILFNNS